MSIRIGDTIIANSTVQIDDATTEKSGLIKLASAADIIAGTNNTKAVTPSQLSQAKVKVDGKTIENTSTGLKVTGVTSKNNELIYNWIGTEADYNAAWNSGIIEEDWICWITDDNIAIPSATVNDSTITFKMNNDVIGSFTTNSDHNVDINIPISSNLQTTDNLVTSISASSTDSQYPSAKLLYDLCGDIESLINAL